MGHRAFVVAVGDWFGRKPFNYGLFNRVGKEVIASGTVVTDVVTRHVILQR